jgi:two-component system OmpR family sensor kinase
LISGVVVLTVVLVVVPAGLAYVRVRRDLLRRLDDQLLAASQGSLYQGIGRPGEDGPAPQALWMTLLTGAATVPVPLPRNGPFRHLWLSTADRERLASEQALPMTVRTVDGHSLRVISEPVSQPAGTVLVLGLSTDSVREPLHHLLLLELLLGLGAAAVALSAVAGIRYSMRPLRRLTNMAQLVAADLSTHGANLDRRAPLEPARAHTETGELTSAFNTLLDVVETEFTARSASEQRMRQFLADASHELRTPLTSIQGYAELENIRQRVAGNHESNDSLSRIRAEGNRMAQLIDELLTLARADQGHPIMQEPVDLGALAQDAVDLTRAAHPDREIHACLEAGLATNGDAAQLLRVLRNLLTNAAIHTEPAGSIRLDARSDDNSALISVSDDGPGMSLDQAQHAFDRFWRADRSRVRATGGNGLGLAIVESTIVTHGGTVELDTSVANGTTVTIRLPAQQPTGHASTPGTSSGFPLE